MSALAGVVVILLVISVSSSDTNQTKALASNVEKVVPAPGGLQRPQAEISVDLEDGYVGRLVIDNQAIPDDQLEKVLSLGQYTYRPGKGQTIEEFVAGTHNAEVFYWPADETEPATPQSFKWEFRVTS